MSSSTSDIIIDSLSYIQRKFIFTKEQFHSFREYFFQSIGFSIILYCFSRLIILFYLFLKLLFRLIFSSLFWLPTKTIELILPKTTNYDIIFPLFWVCSIVSFSIAKFSPNKFGKRYSFNLKFILLLLLQCLFILLPIATSIHEQQKLSLVKTPIVVKETVRKLCENNKPEEFASVNMNLKTKLSSSLGEDSQVKSDVEDDYVKQEMSTAKKLPTNSQVNDLVDSTQQFTSKILENSSAYIQEKTKSRVEKEESITFRQKFNNWLDDTWNIWYQMKLDFRELFSSSKKHTQYSPRYNVSSIYIAFTDLNCYDYTKSIRRYRLFKEKYIYFLHTYRHQSPFPIYLSIIKSNGPKCYRHYSDSFCAMNSKLSFLNIKRQLYRFTLFWMIISIPIIILIVIYKKLHLRQQYNTTNRSLDVTNALPSEEISSDINQHHPLDKNIEEELYLWLKHEENNGYQNISESYRMALNETFSKQYVSKSSRLFKKP